MSSLLPTDDTFSFEHAGFCEICENPTIFKANHPYFRNSLKCPLCKSAPRQLAIWHYLNFFMPNWRQLFVHEGSPGWDRVSQRIAKECPNYTASQYDPAVPFGTEVADPRALAKKYRSENLESQTFEDEKFDVVLTQDVFEHIFYPDRAIKEIYRTLRPGGMAIMTVPIVMKQRKSRRRALLRPSGEIEYILDAQYHGNPMSDKGSLVVVDWGYDIVSYLQYHSDLSFVMMQLDNINIGVRADLCEVLVGFKRPIPEI